MNGRLFGCAMAAVAVALWACGCASEDTNSGTTATRKGHWVYVDSTTGSRLQDRVWVDDSGRTNSQSQANTYAPGVLQHSQGPVNQHNLRPMTGGGS